MNRIVSKTIEDLSDGCDDAEIILRKVHDWGVGGPFFFNLGAEYYPKYFRGERIAKLAEILSELDSPADEGETLRTFMRFLMWKKSSPRGWLGGYEDVNTFFREHCLAWGKFDLRVQQLFCEHESRRMKELPEFSNDEYWVCDDCGKPTEKC